MATINPEDYKGYRSAALNTLQKIETPNWSDVEILTDEENFKGLGVLPRSETADEFHIVLKMPIGYNIGIAAEKIKNIKIFGGSEKRNTRFREKDFPYNPKKPNVKLLGTGGTIASRLDYEPAQLFQHSLQANFMVQFLNLQTSVILIRKKYMAFSAKIWVRNNG